MKKRRRYSPIFQRSDRSKEYYVDINANENRDIESERQTFIQLMYVYVTSFNQWFITLLNFGETKERKPPKVIKSLHRFLRRVVKIIKRKIWNILIIVIVTKLCWSLVSKDFFSKCSFFLSCDAPADSSRYSLGSNKQKKSSKQCNIRS